MSVNWWINFFISIYLKYVGGVYIFVNPSIVHKIMNQFFLNLITILKKQLHQIFLF